MYIWKSWNHQLFVRWNIYLNWSVIILFTLKTCLVFLCIFGLGTSLIVASFDHGMLLLWNTYRKYWVSETARQKQKAAVIIPYFSKCRSFSQNFLEPLGSYCRSQIYKLNQISTVFFKRTGGFCASIWDYFQQRFKTQLEEDLWFLTHR